MTNYRDQTLSNKRIWSATTVSLRGAEMLYIFNRNNGVHIAWNATEKRDTPRTNAKSGVVSALSFIWTRSAG